MANRMTRVRLLNVPLERDYKQTIYFENQIQQKTYFESEELTHRDLENFNYIRKDSKIRVGYPIDDLLDFNYLYYLNSYSNNTPSQRIYCFITKMEYIDDNRTDIYIETDVMQTYLAGIHYDIKPSFIEREHVDNDTVGLHTIPEQLETGDYKVNNRVRFGGLLPSEMVMATTVNLNRKENGKFVNGVGTYYNSVYSGLKYYYMTANKINEALEELANTGQIESVVAIFHVPSMQIEFDTTQTYYEVKASSESIKDTWEIEKLSSIDGYLPKNKKLFTFPYCYMLMTNNSGSSAIFYFEKFNSSKCEFDIRSALTVGYSSIIYPKDYNGVDLNQSEMLCAGKYPVCAWASDIYTNWLTQNSINIGTSLASSGLQVVGGAGAMLGGLFTGGLTSIAGVGAMVNGFTGIANTLGEIYSHSLQPPQAEGNINCGDAIFSSNNLTFSAFSMSIKKEFAEIIDKYFNMYGYRVNRIGMPLYNHREKWWFTKTISINIDSDGVYVEDLQKIKDVYNNGILFVKPEYARNIDFTSSNNIV